MKSIDKAIGKCYTKDNAAFSNIFAKILMKYVSMIKKVKTNARMSNTEKIRTFESIIEDYEDELNYVKDDFNKDFNDYKRLINSYTKLQ